MTISKLAMIIFFLVYGINSIWHFPSAVIVLGITALIAGIALIANS